MSLSTKVDNKEKGIFILGVGLTQGLGEHSLSAEKMYLINFTKASTKFCLSLHYSEQRVICLLMVEKFINFK